MNAQRQEKSRLSAIKRKKRIATIVTFAVCAYFVVSIINNYLGLYKEQYKIKELNREIASQTLENDELKSILNGGDESEYVERIAREELGYARVNERVFVDLAGSK